MLSIFGICNGTKKRPEIVDQKQVFFDVKIGPKKRRQKMGQKMGQKSNQILGQKFVRILGTF